jgi:hypothetical protein
MAMPKDFDPNRSSVTAAERSRFLAKRGTDPVFVPAAVAGRWSGSDEAADEDMSASDHLDEAHAALTQARGCDEDDEENRHAHACRAAAHLQHYFEKSAPGDAGEIGDPDGSKLRETEKTYEERAHTSDLQRDAVRIASNSQPGTQHFAGVPRRR